MTAVDERVETFEITEPGIYPDLPIEDYHAQRGSLSHSGAKKLLPPSCPALFDFERHNPPESTKTFDAGHAAHAEVLGVGAEIVVIPGDRWDTSDAKARVKAAREAGQVPVKQALADTVKAMATALRAHPIASALLGDGGAAEQSLFWTDERTGILRRARLDWRPAPRAARTIGVDYKTTASADPEKFAKSAMDYGYHSQADYYLDGMRATGLADKDAQFLFIVQEKTAPYLVTVVQLDAIAMRIGEALNRRAIDIFAECTRTGVWPGYSDHDVSHVSLPSWYERQFEEQM